MIDGSEALNSNILICHGADSIPLGTEIEQTEETNEDEERESQVLPDFPTSQRQVKRQLLNDKVIADYERDKALNRMIGEWL